MIRTDCDCFAGEGAALWDSRCPWSRSDVVAFVLCDGLYGERRTADGVGLEQSQWWSEAPESTAAGAAAPRLVRALPQWPGALQVAHATGRHLHPTPTPPPRSLVSGTTLKPPPPPQTNQPQTVRFPHPFPLLFEAMCL